MFVACPIGVTGIDAASGKKAWEIAPFATDHGERAIASPVVDPVVDNDMVFATCVFTSSPKHLVTLRPGRGDSPGDVQEVWRVDNASVPHIPSLIIYDEQLYAWSDQGICTCYNAATGKRIWKKRIGGRFFGSPVCLDGRLYRVDDAGICVVIATGDTYKELARNDLGDSSHARRCQRNDVPEDDFRPCSHRNVPRGTGDRRVNHPSDDTMDGYSVRVPTSEQLLINVALNLEAPRVLCTTIGRAQFAKALAELHPETQVQCHFLDLYQASESRDYLDMTGSRVDIICSPDLPDGEFDLFALPTTRGGEAELTRELLQQGYTRLKEGGTLLVSVDNPRDTWLHHEIEKLTRSITRLPKKRGVLYRATKKGPLKRERDFYAEFAFRDGDHLIRAVSRPGVFSHRRLDLGARALMEGMTVQPGDRVLDIGCGAGVVGLAAAMRGQGITVHAVDSNVRAVECTLRGAELNDLDCVTAQADADGNVDQPGTFDVVVGNPPYFSQYRIAEIFLQAAVRALRPGGRVQMVTKHPDWFLARMGQLFDNVSSAAHRGYEVISAIQRS